LRAGEGLGSGAGERVRGGRAGTIPPARAFSFSSRQPRSAGLTDEKIRLSQRAVGCYLDDGCVQANLYKFRAKTKLDDHHQG
ncbi:unnamed protein product, partial [Urochloa humidicola]